MKSRKNTKAKPEPVVSIDTMDENQIVLFNDDVNTFDHVINSLMEVCDHDFVQAEQCSIIVHYNGKCSVKNGDFDFLKPMCEALLDRGLTAAIE